ncbi:WD repeat-containing protein 13 [Blattella germanica]|nr:WD repeat-containing protein 13 [Blattella germanica]
MAAVWQQQVFALDARYNAHRAPNHPNFRTLYIRRRSQLLREHTKGEDSLIRKQYLKIRNQLLQQRYGVSCDQTSIRSRSISARSSSRISESPEISRFPSENNFLSEQGAVVPTKQAEASRAIVGGTSISENYAFVGVHHIFDQHTAGVTMLKFANNDRSRLCCASFDGTVSICNVTANPPQVEVVLKGHKKGVTGCDWSVSNDLMVTCSLDATLCLWDVTSQKCLRAVKDQMGAEMLSCLFQPANNNMVIAGNSRGMVEVLNVSTGIYPRGGSSKLGGKVLALTFDASGQLLWAGNNKGMIVSFLFDLESGRLSKLRRLTVAENCSITCISWRAWISREARDPTLLVNCAANVVCLFRLLIVTGSEDSCVYFLDIEKEEKPCVNKLQGHACPVLGVSFNYDESLLATSDYQGLVIIWKREKPPSTSSQQNT